MEDAISFAIAWGPAILFLLIVVFSGVFGLLIGFRRSKIFFLHTIIAVTISALIYFFFVNNRYTDEFIVKLINLFLGSSSGLQDRLGVNSNLSSFSSILIEFIPKSMNLEDGFKLLLEDNGAYILALVNMIYHIVFFIICYVLYLIIKLILWITYLLFYSDSKFKKKRMYQVYVNDSDELYRKRRGLGALLGVFRGMIGGVISLSIIGSVFYIATGGVDSSKLTKIESNNAQINNALTFYDYIETYGNDGIFGILNEFKDNEGTPYYLMISDIVLQGNLSDKENDINRIVYLRKELGTYVNLAKRTLNMVVRYGGDEVEEILNGESSGNINNIIAELLIDPGFSSEFKSMIYDLDDNLFAINFGMNIISSIASNVDELSFTSGINEDIKEVIKIMFKKDYYSSYIPEENELMNKEDKKTLPYVRFNNLFNKTDFIEIYDLVSTLFKQNHEEGKIDAISAVENAIPHISKLSMFNSKQNNVSRVLGRLYSFAANKYLQGIGSSVSLDDYFNRIDYIDWGKEIKYLADSCSDALYIYNNALKDNSNIIDALFGMFDVNDENYDIDCVNAYDKIINNLSKSQLLNEVMGTNLINDMITNSIASASESFVMPEKIKFVSDVDSEGHIVSRGETLNFFYGLKAIASNEVIGPEIRAMIKGEGGDFLELLENNYSEFNVCKYEGGFSIFNYLIESDILESLVSSLIIDNSKTSVLYIPNSVLIESSSGQKMNIIAKGELRSIFDNMSDLLDVIRIAKDSGTDGINSILTEHRYRVLLDNKIVQGTVGKVFNEQLGDNQDIIIPVDLKRPEGWINSLTTKGELANLIAFIDYSNISISSLTSGEDQIFVDIMKNFDDPTYIDLMLESKVIYYTLSNKLQSSLNFDNMKVIVPDTSKTRLVNDTIPYIISKQELRKLFQTMNEIDISTIASGSNEESLKRAVINRKLISGSEILLTTFAHYIVNSDIVEYIDIPTSLDKMHDGSEESLTTFALTNNWRTELNIFLEGLDELFDISTSDAFILEKPYIENRFKELVGGELLEPSNSSEGRTSLEVCYDSMIISYSLTKTIDDAISEELLSNDSIRRSCKNGNVYSINEVKNLLEAVKALNVDVNNLSNYNFMENLNSFLEISNNETKLHRIYKSRLIAGIISEEIYDTITSSSALVHTGDAYERDIDIYRESEVESLIRIVGSNTFDENFNVNSISLDDFINTIFSYDGVTVETKSYLIVGALSKKLNEIDNLVVPQLCLASTLPDGTSIINSRDIYDLLVALKALNINELDNVDISTLKITRSCGEALSNSSIMRATLVSKLKISNGVNDIDIIVRNSREYAIKTNDIKNHGIVLLSQKEIYSVIDALISIDGGDLLPLEFNFTYTKISEIAANDELLDKVLASSILHFALSEVLKAEADKLGVDTGDLDGPVETIYFRGLLVKQLDYFSRQQLIDTISFINNVMSTFSF